MRYVIAGAGPAGVTAAETLRKADPESEIVLINGEDHPPYGRMAIPYFLTGQINEKGLLLRKKGNHFENLDIKVIRGLVEGIETKKQVIFLGNGERIAFDKLLVATGSRPLEPKISGLDSPSVFYCWSLKDARKILRNLGNHKKILLIGAGFIGSIIMEAVFLSGLEVTIAESRDQMVPGMIDKTGGQLVKTWCEGKGINVFTSSSVTLIEHIGGALRAYTTNGRRIEVDCILVATGVQPNTHFLEDSDVRVCKGVIVDNSLQTNIESIFAAGDVAEGPEMLSGFQGVHAIQTTCVEHGRVAALNMAGKKTYYRGSLNMNILDTMGLVSCSFGQWGDRDGIERASTLFEDDFRYTVLNFLGDKLIGAIMVGYSDSIGILRGLIQSSIQLGKWKKRLLNNPNKVFEWYIHGLGA